jgi:hypothetical protein
MTRQPVYKVLATDGSIYEDLTLEQILSLPGIGEFYVWATGWRESEDKDE